MQYSLLKIEQQGYCHKAIIMKPGELKRLIRECIIECLTESMDVQFDDFTKSYIETALWSSVTNGTIFHHTPKDKWDTEYDEDDDEPEGDVEVGGGEVMDKNYTIEDICPNTLRKMFIDCQHFQQNYRRFFERGEWTDKEAGHDFWLTRNHHGTGFWDRGYGDERKEEFGELLTKAAHSYGEFNLYLGDGPYDGMICGSKG